MNYSTEEHQTPTNREMVSNRRAAVQERIRFTILLFFAGERGNVNMISAIRYARNMNKTTLKPSMDAFKWLEKFGMIERLTDFRGNPDGWNLTVKGLDELERLEKFGL